jgi:hypothetical protein
VSFLAFAPTLTEEDGGGRVAIGHGFDVHGRSIQTQTV